MGEQLDGEGVGDGFAGGCAAGGGVGVDVIFLAAENGGDGFGIDRVGEGADLGGGDAELLMDAPIAGFAAGAGEEFEDDGAGGFGGAAIHHIEDFKAARPGGSAELAGVEAGLNIGEVLFPGRLLLLLGGGDGLADGGGRADGEAEDVVGVGCLGGGSGVGAHIAADFEVRGGGGFAEDAAFIGFEDDGPEVFAAAEVLEIGAFAVDAEQVGFVGEADVVAAGALDFAIEMGLIGLGEAHGAGLEEALAFELEASLKLKG